MPPLAAQYGRLRSAQKEAVKTMKTLNSLFRCMLVGGLGLATPLSALAQGETPEAAPAPATPAAPPAAEAPLAPAAPTEPAPVSPEEPVPAEPASPEVEVETSVAVAIPVVESPAAEEETTPEDGPAEPPSYPSDLNVAIGLRTGVSMAFNDPAADGPALTLTDGVASQLNARAMFGGQLTEKIGFTFNLETTQSSVDVLDAIVQVKVAEEFQIWLGQHIPAMERNNFNGPFYHNGWNLPIGVQTLPFDIAGRDRGVTFWGLVSGGVFKYHLSLVDLAPPAQIDFGGTGDDATTTEAAGLENARVAARATINLLDPENYYYTSGTYYGGQDTLALGAVVHYQQGVDALDGSDLDNDLLAFTADLLFEKVVEGSGTFTFNGGYWNFEETGAGYVPNQGTANFGSGVIGPVGASSYLVGLSWLTPNKIGAGKLQPNLTLQIGDYDETMVIVDAAVGYIVDDFNHRWYLNFRHQDMGGQSDPIDMLQLGAQVQL